MMSCRSNPGGPRAAAVHDARTAEPEAAPLRQLEPWSWRSCDVNGVQILRFTSSASLNGQIRYKPCRAVFNRNFELPEIYEVKKLLNR